MRVDTKALHAALIVSFQRICSMFLYLWSKCLHHASESDCRC